MNLFVTGANGFIGKNFVKHALAQGHFVYAVSRRKLKLKKQENLLNLVGDFYNNWEKELKDSDVLIHFACAGVKKKVNLMKSMEINVHKSFQLLQNAYNAKCLRWVVISSSSEYGELLKSKKRINNKQFPLPVSNYGFSKMIFTYLSMNYAIRVKAKCRVIRLFQVYGEGESKSRLWPKIKKAAENNQLLQINNPFEKRDFNNIENIKNDLLEICHFKNNKNITPEIWHLASGKSMTVLNFAKKVYQKYNKKIKIKYFNNSNKQYHHISDLVSIWSKSKSKI